MAWVTTLSVGDGIEITDSQTGRVVAVIVRRGADSYSVEAEQRWRLEWVGKDGADEAADYVRLMDRRGQA